MGETGSAQLPDSPSFWKRLGKWAKAHEVAAFGLFLSLSLICAYPGVFFGAKAFFFRDYGVLGYPFIYQYREAILSGELPLWNPYSNCGAPFLAQWGTMVLYPLNLLCVLFPMPWALGFFCLLHLWIGGMGMHRLARSIGIGRFGCALAGTIYVFNGATLSSLMWANYTVVLAWLPWVLWSCCRAWRDGGRWLLLAALFGALQMLCGVPEVILFTWFTALVWLLAETWTARKGLRPLVRFGSIVVLVAGLCAAQLLPFMQMLSLSHRVAGFGDNRWSIPLWGWINLVVPMIRQRMTHQGTFFQEGQEFISTYYMGVAVLVLAGFGVWKSSRRMRWLWLGLAILGLTLAMGANLPGYTALRSAIPVWSVIRFPVKFLYLAMPALVLLAATGWQTIEDGLSDGWLRDGRKAFILIAAVGGAMAVAVGLAWTFRIEFDNWQIIPKNTVERFLVYAVVLVLLRHLLLARDGAQKAFAGLAALTLMAGDACLHYPKLNPALPARVFDAGVIRDYQKFPEVTPENFYRIFITPKAEGVLLISTVPQFEEEFFGRRLALWSNLNLLDDMPKVNGSSTLPLKWEKEVEELIYSRTNHPPVRLVDFLGARYETASDSVVKWVARKTALPIVTAGQKLFSGEAHQVLHELGKPDFEPLQQTWLEAPLPAGFSNEETKAAVTQVVFRRNRVSFAVTAPKETVAVIAQTWHPAWQAVVNGQPVEVLRVNHAFQAVVVPAGRSTVVLRFKDQTLYAGLLITTISALLMLVCWLWLSVEVKKSGNA